MALLRFLFVAGALLPLLEAANASVKYKNATYKDNSWDHFVFMQQYPAGVCYHSDSSSNLHKNACYYPRNASVWTVHGLWPSRGSEKAPNSCNTSAVFNLSVIEDMVSTLVAEWTDLEPYKGFGSFWCHEWLKHGTCYTTSQHFYFNRTLTLFNSGLKLGPILASCEIMPSMTQHYQMDDFLNCITNKLQAQPYMECVTGKSGEPVLIQMGVCLNKDTLRPTKCPSGSASSNSCKSDVGILYPPSMYTK